MSGHGWTDAPEPIRRQVDDLSAAFKSLLGADLIGIYLHGSLATGCHNPARSDIDLLIALRRGLDLETKRAVGELLLERDRRPCPLELSAMTLDQLRAWRYPPPYDFHFGDNLADDLASGAWRHWNDAERTDPDLAAHVTMLARRGLCLYGPPVAEVFPRVPAGHYRAALLDDFAWGRERLSVRPMYFVLNACRILAALEGGAIQSKDEGGEWGLKRLPARLHPLIRRALAEYRGERPAGDFDFQALEAFADELSAAIGASA